MAFPDRIERTVDIAHPPATVWAALTTPEGLGNWFGHKATIDLHPFLSVVAVMVLSSLFGIVGALTAVPVTRGIQIAVDAVREARRAALAAAVPD